MIEVVLCTDDNYVMPTGVLMESIARTNAGVEFHYNVVTAGLSDESKAALKTCAKAPSSVDFFTIDKSILASCPIRPDEHVSIATYFRLLLPSIMPANVDKLLYLDGDIICTGSLQELWNVDLNGFSAAAAPDMRCNDKTIFERLSLPLDSEYLNAGVMLINLDWWRKNDVQNNALKYISENSDACLFHDQDALNVVLHGTMRRISVRFNYQEHFFEPFEKQKNIDGIHFDDIESSKNDLRLIHYTGRKKPWHRECVNPLKTVWQAVYFKSIWKDKKLGYKYSGMKRVRHVLRKKLEFIGLVKSKSPYRDIDVTSIEKKLIAKF